MDAPLRYRCEVTPELVARATPQLDALFVWWNDRAQEAASARRRLSPAAFRRVGLGLSLLGIAVAGFSIVTAPDSTPCRPRSFALFYDAVMPFFVVTATFFGFWPRILPELRAWTGRVASRQAARFAGMLARAAPYAADYELAQGLLTARIPRLKTVKTTELRRVEHAAFAADVAILHGGRFPRFVKRIVWLPPPGPGREALCEAIRGAGATVVDLPDAGPTARPA